MTYQQYLQRESNDFRKTYGFEMPWDIPNYTSCDVGLWSIRNRPGGAFESYMAEIVIDKDHTVLCHDGAAWMSTSMLEIESHAWHLHCARGNVLIAGLGMGMYLHAVAAKPEVDKVVVLELDSQVIELFKKSTDFDEWPMRDKIEIINMDALTAEAKEPVQSAFEGRGVDYLYVDIWPVFPAVEAPSDTRKMIQIHKPAASGWWGQEVEYGLWLEAGAMDSSPETLAAFFEHHGLTVPSTQGYADYCRDVVGHHFRPQLKARSVG